MKKSPFSESPFNRPTGHRHGLFWLFSPKFLISDSPVKKNSGIHAVDRAPEILRTNTSQIHKCRFLNEEFTPPVNLQFSKTTTFSQQISLFSQHDHQRH